MEERRERSCGGRVRDGVEITAGAERSGLGDVTDGDEAAASRAGEPGMLASFPVS